MDSESDEGIYLFDVHGTARAGGIGLANALKSESLDSKWKAKNIEAIRTVPTGTDLKSRARTSASRLITDHLYLGSMDPRYTASDLASEASFGAKPRLGQYST